MFTKGTFLNPIVTRVMRINVDVDADYDIETDLDDIRRAIYDNERINVSVVEFLNRYEAGIITERSRLTVRDFDDYSAGRKSRNVEEFTSSVDSEISSGQSKNTRKNGRSKLFRDVDEQTEAEYLELAQDPEGNAEELSSMVEQ